MRIFDIQKQHVKSMDTSFTLHVMISQKFTASFIEFVKSHFPDLHNSYEIIGPMQWEYGLTPEHGVSFRSTEEDFQKLLCSMKVAKKIILHGLWNDSINKLLTDNPELLAKSFWIIWGGDLYDKYWLRDEWPIQEEIRRLLIRDIGFIVTNSNNDFNNVCKWYETKAKHIKCFCYTSNIVYPPKKEFWSDNQILIGNSATYTNNHLEIFNKLLFYPPPSNFKLITPLSYGDKNYAQTIQSIGTFLFQNRFAPLTEFMTPRKYQELLYSISTAVMAHDRQQAFGNIINLLGSGARVYLKKSNPLWLDLTDDGFELHDLDSFDKSAYLSHQRNQHNIDIAQHIYSETHLVNSLREILQ